MRELFFEVVRGLPFGTLTCYDFYSQGLKFRIAWQLLQGTIYDV
jgi:hypothetical protein